MISFPNQRRCIGCDHPIEGADRTLRELMYGTGEAFSYGRCGTCSSLSIMEIPQDLGRFYPKDYYSLGQPAPLGSRERLSIGMASVIRGGARRLVGTAIWPMSVAWIWKTSAGPDSAILDVGCGTGRVVRSLAARGWRGCEGIDPFLPEPEIVDPSGARIRRKTIAEMDRGFDLITFHHVIEHLENPAEALRQARERLSPGGEIVIGVPLFDSWASRRYGDEWVQLDPPRHLFIPTEDGVRRLAARAGLQVVHHYRDSCGFGLWGSRALQRRLPLSRRQPGRVRRFVYGLWSTALNLTGQGDTGIFVLRDAGEPRP